MQTTDLLGWITALWGFRIRRAPPSKCYLADQIQPVPRPQMDFKGGTSKSGPFKVQVVAVAQSANMRLGPSSACMTLLALSLSGSLGVSLDRVELQGWVLGGFRSSQLPNVLRFGVSYALITYLSSVPRCLPSMCHWRPHCTDPGG